MLWIQKLKPAWGGSNFTQKNKILDTFADIVIYHVVLRCVNGTDAIMAKGIEGLSDISKKPHNSSNKKLREQLIEKILTLRNERNIRTRRIQLELFIPQLMIVQVGMLWSYISAAVLLTLLILLML